MNSCRLIAVNGPMQLISAVAAMREHLKISGADGADCVLGLQPLHAPSEGRAQALEHVIRRIAPALHPWRAIMDLRQIDLMPGQSLPVPNEAELNVSEIHFNLIELPENQRLIRQWPQAARICYGDGLGIHTSLADFQPTGGWRRIARQALGLFVPRWRSVQIPAKTPGDTGFFLLDDHDAASHFREVQRLGPSHYRRVFEESCAAWDGPALAPLLAGDESCDVLLLTNLASGDIHLNREAEAYMNIITVAEGGRPHTILVKPHPRGRTDMLEQLCSSLQMLYRRVIVLADEMMTAAPVELLLSRAFEAGYLLADKCRIFATSTAAYGMPVLLGLPVKIGFGVETCHRLYQRKAALKLRLKHERQLDQNLRFLDSCMEVPACG